MRMFLLAAAVTLMAAGPARASEPARVRVLITQTSADLSQAMRSLPGRRFSPTARIARGVRVIDVDDTRRYQRFIGAGGGMTDTSAWLIWTQLAPAQRSRLLKLLFASSGAHLSFLRVPIGASDYTADGVAYSYDDEPPGQADPGLTDFSVAHDGPYVLPALRTAQQLNPNIYLEGVPWTAPGWMKANDALDNHDHAGTLLPGDDAAYGRYLADFVRAYAERGVRVAGIAVQDEPNEPNPYPGMQISSAQEAELVAHFIRPALRAADVSVNVFGWDLSWGPKKAVASLMSDTETGALSGLAWHCYAGSPQFMSSAHAAVPKALQIVDECSTGTKDLFPTSELLISSTRNWAGAVALWNLALDPQGGPALSLGYGCGGCTGVVTVDPQTGRYTLSRDRRPADRPIHAQPRLLRARPIQPLHPAGRGAGRQPPFRLLSAGRSRALPDRDQLRIGRRRVLGPGRHTRRVRLQHGDDADLLCDPLAPQHVHLPDPAARHHDPAMAIEGRAHRCRRR